MNNTFKLFMLSGMTCIFSLQQASALTGTPEKMGGNAISIIENSPTIRYNNMIFGQFIEHFHTQIYGGIYDPSSRFADEDGFCTGTGFHNSRGTQRSLRPSILQTKVLFSEIKVLFSKTKALFLKTKLLFLELII